MMKLNTSVASSELSKANDELITEVAELNRSHLHIEKSKDLTLSSKCPMFEESKSATVSWACVKDTLSRIYLISPELKLKPSATMLGCRGRSVKVAFGFFHCRK